MLTFGPEGPRGIDDVNDHLASGWRVESVTAMGGGGASHEMAAIIVLERAGTAAEAVLEALEEELDDVMDGDGSEVPGRDIDLGLGMGDG